MGGNRQMLNKVSVLIPYKQDNGIRDKLFNWVKRFYENAMPEVELCIGENHDNLFNRSKALNNAAKIATKDVFVIADSDVIYNPQLIVQSIKLLDQYTWIIPYSKWLDLTKESTKNLLKMTPEWPVSTGVKYVQRHKNKKFKPISGVLVLPREKFNAVGGFDDRFKGWGREDKAFRDAVNTLCGPYNRCNEGFLYHLWHPRLGPKGNPGIVKNNQLYMRYKKSIGNVKKMKDLIKKA